MNWRGVKMSPHHLAHLSESKKQHYWLSLNSTQKDKTGPSQSLHEAFNEHLVGTRHCDRYWRH